MPTLSRAATTHSDPARDLSTVALSDMARDDSDDLTTRAESRGDLDSPDPDLGNGMSAQRKALLRAWAPIMNRLRKASLPITFAFDESDGYWAFVLRRLNAFGLVVADEDEDSITLRAIAIPQQENPDSPPTLKYGTAPTKPPEASDDSPSSAS